MKFYVPARVTLKRMLQQQQQPILIDVAFSDEAEGSVGSILAHPFDELDWHFNRLLTVGGVYSMSAWASALAASVLFQARRMVRGMDPSPSNVTMSRDKNNAHVAKKKKGAWICQHTPHFPNIELTSLRQL